MRAALTRSVVRRAEFSKNSRSFEQVILGPSKEEATDIIDKRGLFKEQSAEVKDALADLLGDRLDQLILLDSVSAEFADVAGAQLPGA